MRSNRFIPVNKMTSKKKILITGGSGFIGSHIAEKCINEGHEISIIDVKPPINPNHLSSFINGDIFDLSLLERLVPDYDVIVHLIGLANAGTAQKEPMKSFNLNVLSLQNILDAIRTSGKKIKIIFPSSAAVYGMTDDLPIKENCVIRPTNIYSWHKYLCEQMIRSYQEQYGISYIILRFFNVYGKGNEGVIRIFLDLAKNGKTITSFGPYQYRDFIYSADVAEAVYNATIYNKATNKTINIGSGKGIQIRDILDIVCNLYPDATWIEEESTTPLYDSIADITLAKILLDFNPHCDLDFFKNIIINEMQ